MRFDKGIVAKYQKSVEDAFEVILDKGNLNQRFVAQSILDSEMVLCAHPVSAVCASGITGVINPERTNERILSERLDIEEAFAEIFITIACETIDTGFQRGCEGTLIHEGRHAFDFAGAIASFSAADVRPDEVFNPTLYALEWEAHKTSADYMIRIGRDEYVQEGLQMGILQERGGNYYTDYNGIKRRLQNDYKINESEQGDVFNKRLGLTIRK